MSGETLYTAHAWAVHGLNPSKPRLPRWEDLNWEEQALWDERAVEMNDHEEMRQGC